VTIKGTLETFNLRELIQMLAFNRKVGTLVLETEKGPRALYMDQGRVAFLTTDTHVSRAFARRLRRMGTIDADRLDRAEEIHRHSGRFVGDVVLEMGLLDGADRTHLYEEVVGERLFNAQLTAIHRFEFIDGKAVRPDGEPGEAIEPALQVDGLLLELTRKIDHWTALSEVIPSLNEIFEGTGLAVDLAESEEFPADAADIVVPCVDGCRSVDQIAEASHVDLYTVTQVLAALYQEGAIRPVPSDDLVLRAEEMLARGDAQGALPLLRRAIERGDAPADARLKMADAHEAAGEPEAAAAELDTYAALSTGDNAPGVFAALRRALRLRGGDVATASRVCDYYLRNRPWLKDARGDAVAALRELIQSATAEGRPLDAAGHLAGFLSAGDVPTDDLLLLGDLHAQAGDHTEAAAAFYRRAEDLLLANRVVAARDLLRRVLEHDPTRADARRLLLDLEGADRRRQRKTRVVFLFVLLTLVVLGVCSAWWIYSRSAQREISVARERAEQLLDEAERKARAAIADFQERANRAESQPQPDPELELAAKHLKLRVREIMDAPQADLAAYASELENYTASGHEDSHRIILRGLEHRRQTMLQRAEQAVAELALRATAALEEAHRQHQAGNFIPSRDLLRKAQNLALGNEAVRTRASQLLGHVDAYFQRFHGFEEQMRQARESGAVGEAYRIGLDAVKQLMDSDLTRTLAFPVEVSSDPPGAEVWLGSVRQDLATPCVVTYSLFTADPVLRLRLPGRTTRSFQLPSYEALQNGTMTEEYTPRHEAVLPPGPRLTQPGPFTTIWSVQGTPMLVDGEGRQALALDTVSGATVASGPEAPVGSVIRLGGVLPGRTEWRIQGHRTLRVQPSHGSAWEFQSMGLLERSPAMAEAVVVVVDEAGMLYGLDAAKGTELWRRRLDGEPTQGPLASHLGLVIATGSGSFLKIDPRQGGITPIAPAARGAALALPLGEGVLLLGGGEGGARFVGSDGEVRTLGDSRPHAAFAPWVSPGIAVWIDEGGPRFATSDDTTPRPARGLGESVLRLAAGDGRLYGVDAQGRLSAVPVERPDEAAWRIELGSGAPSAMVLTPLSLTLLLGERLVVVDR